MNDMDLGWIFIQVGGICLYVAYDLPWVLVTVALLFILVGIGKVIFACKTI